MLSPQGLEFVRPDLLKKEKGVYGVFVLDCVSFILFNAFSLHSLIVSFTSATDKLKQVSGIVILYLNLMHIVPEN